MKKIFFYICLFLCIFCGAGSVNGEQQKDTTDKKEHLVGMPNPAAVYSTKLGYKYEIRKGGYGVVVFPDGTECKGWDFYRGKAGQKWSYCEQHEGKIENRVENMGTWTAEYAVCVFPNGSECSEMDYMDGKGGPGVYKKWSPDEKKCIRFNKPSLSKN